MYKYMYMYIYIYIYIFIYIYILTADVTSEMPIKIYIHTLKI